ncbi:MAG: hypothetical protein R2762_15125 [Bryobacteraceae bacterium]
MLPWIALALTFSLPDSSGHIHSSDALPRSKATVFVFLAPQCPLSRAVIPELRDLHRRFSSRGIGFFTVNGHLPSGFPDLADPTHSIARQLEASITPQAVVVSGRGEILYTGRVDDRAESLTRTRPAPTRRDLRLALEQVLAGADPDPKRTRAVGCTIEFPAPASDSAPTYSRQIAPILHRHCVECHRPGQSGPFSLLRYQDAAARASTIARVASARLMPPWLPAPNADHPFAGRRALTGEEIRLLEQWAAGGAPRGDSALEPPPPPPPAQWPLGPPDAILRPTAPIPIAGAGPDQYLCFVVAAPLNGTRYVRAFDFRPGSSALHHALLFLDSTQAARRRDAEHAGAGYPCFGTPGFLPSASLGGWTPGNTALAYPAGAAVRFRSGADLVMQIHIHPDGAMPSSTAMPEIALYFQDEPPARRMMDVALGSRRIDIAPGESGYIVRDHFTIPVALEVTGIIPHAHFLAQTMRGWATLPDGSRVELIDIPQWNFNWQQQYRYAEPFVLPAETRIEMEFVYDNSAANPQNPFSPPQRVQWGPDSTDEMAGLHVQVMPLDDEDAEELARYLWGRLMRERWGSLER